MKCKQAEEFDKKLDKYIFVILSEMGNLFLFSESSPYHDKLYWWRQLPFVPEVVLILIMSLLYQFCLKIPFFIYVDFGYGFNFVYQLGTRGSGINGQAIVHNNGSLSQNLTRVYSNQGES